jgi:glycine/D-amino acid oxidase-like deaminating enzyme
VGVCAACYLARRGLPVTLVEKGEIAARPSRDLLQWLLRFCRACTAGHVRRSIPIIRELSRASLDLYRELAGVPGLEFGFPRTACSRSSARGKRRSSRWGRLPLTCAGRSGDASGSGLRKGYDHCRAGTGTCHDA